VPTKIDLRKLPPLNALKGFEATTRRQSVREAADELCVTHPAVSHQIQLLESDLGVPLYSREGRAIVPTPEGLLFYGYVRKALDTLIEGAEALRRSRLEKPLRVQTYVTASIRWLASRIPAFQESHPDVRLQLSTCALEWDFDESLGDVGLVYLETPPGPEFEWVPLFDYALYPVCSPAMRQRLPERAQPKDLVGLPLVVVYTETRNWDIWFQAAQVDYTPGSRVVVDTLAIALQMALDGAGVALANGPFADDDLRSGRLVVPTDHVVRCPGGWGLICRRDALENPKVQAFMTWFGRAAG
jgi:LysR family transcriptional regulator, glycine cleavage system transcriptional activator